MTTRISPYIALTLALVACSPKPISEAQARDLGAKALERYCTSEKLSPANFKIKEIGPSGDAPWFIVYESVGIKPSQEIAVSINKRGAVELSFYVEGRKD
jgi:hypothetical protein